MNIKEYNANPKKKHYRKSKKRVFLVNFQKYIVIYFSNGPI